VRTEKPAVDRIPEITLAQAIPKKGKMDDIVEKVTELGVGRIVPVLSERTVVRPDDDSGKKKVERWRKIAVEAAKQCGRTSVPEIGEITGFGEIAVNLDQYDLVLLACLSDQTSSIKEVLSGFRSGKILVLIGPEGDFTPEEIRLAYRDNCRLVSLGQRVLKSDTAGLFVLSVLNYVFSL